MPIEYVIYCRRSSDESSEKQVQSIPDQIEKCIEYAHKEKLTIMKKPQDFSDFETPKDIFKEDNEKDLHSRRIHQSNRELFIIKESRSAKKPGGRPKRNKLLERIQKGKIKGLISYSPDRQSRNMIDGGIIIEMADDGLVELKYHNFHFNNNASGRMMLGFRFVFSKQYSDKLSEDIGRGNKSTVKKGKSLGKPKYGYYRDEETGLYKPHKKYRPLMKRAFEMTLYEKRSNVYIADWLNANGYRREVKKGNKKELVNGKNLGTVRIDSFYYGVYISGNSIIDMRSGELNPYFKPLINQSEHEILKGRRNSKNGYASPQKRKEKYDEIIPYEPGTVITEDGYALTPYIPNPKRFQERLLEVKKKNPQATLQQVVASKQLRCKCSTKHSKYHKFEVKYSLIEEAVIELFSSLNITDEDYKQYEDFMNNELEKQNRRNIEENNRIQVEINNIKGKKTKYMKDNMHLKRDAEEDTIYQETRLQYDNQIDFLRKQISELDIGERDLLLEFEILVKILRQAPEYFREATYVQQRNILKITTSNIIVTADKQVKIMVMPGLEDIFDPKFSSFGDTNFASEPKLSYPIGNEGRN